VLRALAPAREVHLFLLHPSPALWEKVAAAPRTVPPRRRRHRRAPAQPPARLVGPGLARAAVVLGEHESHHHAGDSDVSTLLGRLQHDIREDRAPEPAGLAPGDRSVQVHACHGRARQVEVVRDAILHLLAEDPSLEPRDVIVMCPDIETFAPLIQAAFGAGEEEEGGLRVRLADRAIRQTNPLLGVAARLLDLASERLTASQVLDLADRDAGPPPLPARRRRSRTDRGLGPRERHPLGPRRRPARAVQARDAAAGTWRAGLDACCSA
jgi:exodeoxyribonuclease V gamma subunit